MVTAPLPAPPPPDQPVAVQTVTVSAARLAPPLSDKVYSVIQIGPAVLDARPRLDEALEEIPGVSLFRRASSLSANPTVEGVSARAIAPTGAGRALVTLDGVPQGDPFGGWVIWNSLPSDSIGSADVVRGAGAGPYGAGALTGTIALKERLLAPGDWRLDAAAGGLGYMHGDGAVDIAAPGGDLSLDASAEHSNGWIPVDAGRGAADSRVKLDDRQLAARYAADLAGGGLVARLAAYGQEQGTGVADGFANAEGTSESLSWAVQPTAETLGGELQVWGRQTNFSQLSLSEAAGHASATPADLQYATPANGLGANGAVRRATAHWSWEAGFDVRAFQGQTHELFSYVAPAFTKRRIAGGRNLIAGVYGEGAVTEGPWLLTAGVRLDAWRDWDGELLETRLSNNAFTTDDHYGARGGTAPTARAGARRDLGAGFYARADAYAGFRPPSLNELYRPYRVGNQSISANPALNPEKLYGAELGAGRDFGWGALDADVFVNKLADPVINVTTGAATLMRENVPAINAVGVEVQGRERLMAGRLILRFAVAYTDATVDGGVSDPQLTGRRPAQAPEWSADGGADWRVAERLTLSLSTRFDGRRFDDDLNQNPLKAALTEDARATWRLTRQAAVFIDGQNLSDAKVATAFNTDRTIDYGAPRIIRVGVTLRR